jgi:hypothetical protein
MKQEKKTYAKPQLRTEVIELGVFGDYAVVPEPDPPEPFVQPRDRFSFE